MFFHCRNERKQRHILKSKKQEEEERRRKEKQEQKEKRHREAEAMDSYDDWMKKKVGKHNCHLAICDFFMMRILQQFFNSNVARYNEIRFFTGR